MRRFLILFLIFCTTSIAYASANATVKNNLPKGTFKKKANGEFVQYNDNGKKIGVYKVTHGKFVRVK